MPYAKHHKKLKERERNERRKEYLKRYMREYYRKIAKKFGKTSKNKEWNKGKNNPNWKGGISSINSRLRATKEYTLWREAVYLRDNFTCVWCGQVGGNLNADHIKPFALFPELRFAIDNGRTLCENCHKTTDTYGGNSRIKFKGGEKWI